MMRDQKKVKQKMTKQQSVMIGIHPELQVKLQLSKVIESKLSKMPASNQHSRNKVNSCLVQNLQHLQSVPYSSFKKYEQATPRRSPRKKIKVNFHYMQEDIQATNLQQWKSKVQAKVSSAQKKQYFNKTNSFAEFKDVSKKYQLAPFEVTTPATSQSKRKTSNFDGQQRMVGNNSYMRKLRTNIQFFSLAAFTKKEPPTGSLSPNVKTIEPLSNRNRQLQPPKNGNSSTFTRKINMKGSRMSKFDEKWKFQPFEVASFRPWSGLRAEFLNESSAHESL